MTHLEHCVLANCVQPLICGTLGGIQAGFLCCGGHIPRILGLESDVKAVTEACPLRGADLGDLSLVTACRTILGDNGEGLQLKRVQTWGEIFSSPARDGIGGFSLCGVHKKNGEFAARCFGL